VHIANFGATVCPQWLTQFSTSETTIEVDAAIGCHRGGRRVTTQDIAPGQHSLAMAVRELYEQEVMTYFKDGRDLPQSECWYGKRHDTKKVRQHPQFTAGLWFESWKMFKIPSPLISSLPPSDNLSLVAVAKFECRLRTLSEWLLTNIFYTLPYGTAAMLAANQLSSACVYAESIQKWLPCHVLCRPLPKGAIGIQRTKDLHDDGNLAVIPRI
jgi:hypothetical protein